MGRNRLEALDEGLRVAGPEMSIPLLRTLVAVSLNSDLSVTELADMIGIPQQSASRYVAVLQGRYQTPGSTNVFADEPLLAHKASATDLRRYELVLTPHGTARINAILNAIYSRGNSE